MALAFAESRGVWSPIHKDVDLEDDDTDAKEQSPRQFCTLGLLATVVFALAWVLLRPAPGAPSLRALESAPKAFPDGRTCLLHAAWGAEYMALSHKYTLPTKEAYARKYSYSVLPYMRDTYEELIMMDFTRCHHGALVRNSSGYDKQTVIKFCSVWEAFEDGCDTVLWTDADAVIGSSKYSLEYWINQSSTADVYYSMSDTGATDKKWSQPWGHTGVAGHRVCLTENFPGLTCPSVALFASCLNSGAFIMRRSNFSWQYLGRVLERSRRSTEPVCETWTLNPSHFDQCNLSVPGKGDQCAISCEAIQDESLLGHFACMGDLHPPIFQEIVISERWPVVRDTFVLNVATVAPHWNHLTAMLKWLSGSHVENVSLETALRVGEYMNYTTTNESDPDVIKVFTNQNSLLA